MDWTVKDRSVKEKSPSPKGHLREAVGQKKWNHSARDIPVDKLGVSMANGIEDDHDLKYRNIDINNALQEAQAWGNGNRLYGKIWHKHTRQVLTNLFSSGEAGHGHLQTMVRQYIRRHPSAVHENIWFDQLHQKIFSNAQTYCSGLDPIEHSFCSPRQSFANQTWNSIASEMGRMIENMVVAYNAKGQVPSADGVTSDDINEGRCYGDLVFPDLRIGLCPAVTGLANQDSVLIIGGGPSTNNIDFSQFQDIPVWTMNNYYKNPLFDQFNNIQVASFLDEVDVFYNDPLWEYVNDRDTIVLQEITDWGTERLSYVKEAANYSSYFHTRYRSKLGIGPRLMITAIILGIRNIYFCGFDGYNTEDVSNNHSFELGKDLPNWIKNSDPGTQERQYVMLFDYLLNDLKLSRSFKLHDLSAGQPTLQYEFLRQIIR